MRVGRNLFGETVSFQRLPSAPFDVRAIFNQAYLMESPNRSPDRAAHKASFEVDARVAIVDFRAIDLPYEPIEGDFVTANTTTGPKTFSIWRVEPDGWARFRCYLGDV